MTHHPVAANGPNGPNVKPRLSIGIACIVLGILGGIATLVITLVVVFSTDGEVPVDGQPHTVSVGAGDERMLFVERDSNTSCTVTDAKTGDPIDLERVSADVSRNVNGTERVAPWKFTPTSDEVEITCTGDTDVDAQVTPPLFTAKGIALVVAGFVLSGAVGVLGIVLLILALIRRSRARRVW